MLQTRRTRTIKCRHGQVRPDQVAKDCQGDHVAAQADYMHMTDSQIAIVVWEADQDSKMREVSRPIVALVAKYRNGSYKLDSAWVDVFGGGKVDVHGRHPTWTPE
jgi:hypothetical protein